MSLRCAGAAARRRQRTKQSLLPQVVDASLLPCVAWQEGLGGIETAAIETRVGPTAQTCCYGHKRSSPARRVLAALWSTRAVRPAAACTGSTRAAGLTVGHERHDETPAACSSSIGCASPTNVVSAAGPQGLAALDRNPGWSRGPGRRRMFGRGRGGAAWRWATCARACSLKANRSRQLPGAAAQGRGSVRAAGLNSRAVLAEAVRVLV